MNIIYNIQYLALNLIHNVGIYYEESAGYFDDYYLTGYSGIATAFVCQQVGGVASQVLIEGTNAVSRINLERPTAILPPIPSPPSTTSTTSTLTPTPAPNSPTTQSVTQSSTLQAGNSENNGLSGTMLALIIGICSATIGGVLARVIYWRMNKRVQNK